MSRNMLDLKRLITDLGAAGRFQALNEIKQILVHDKFNSCLAEERDTDKTVTYIETIIKANHKGFA